MRDLRFYFELILPTLKRYPYFWGIMTLLGGAISLLEAVSLSLLIPILESMSEKSMALPPPLDKIEEIFAGLSLQESIKLIAVLLVVASLLKAFLLYLNGMLSGKLECREVGFHLLRCYKSTMNVKIGFFMHQKGSLFYTTLAQHTKCFGIVARTISMMFPTMFTALVLLGLLILISWKMTLVAMAVAFFSSLVLQILERQARNAGELRLKGTEQLDHTVLDSIQGMKTIRIFNRQPTMIQRIGKDIKFWGEGIMSMVKVQALVRPLFEVTNITSLALLLVAGSTLFIAFGNEGSQIESLLLFLVIFVRLAPPVSVLNQQRVSIVTMIPGCLKVNNFLEQCESEQMKSGTKIFSRLKHEIELKDVSFRYNQEQKMVLNEVSLKIPTGAKVGVVGPSGSGKSTLIELLLRFYDPSFGAILIDGMDLRDFDLSSWRKRIGLVEQRTFLFNDSVRANITYGNPDISFDLVEEAAKRAYAQDFIKELPKGYDTLIGDRGVFLSGGQQQRIAIARAIIQDPEVLIFDEATSALDTESERVVQKALDDVSCGKTVIMIAHRLSTIKDADFIIAIKDGQPIQIGKHHELIKEQDSLYYNLVKMQNLES